MVNGGNMQMTKSTRDEEVTLELNGGGRFIYGLVRDVNEATYVIDTHIGQGIYCRETGRCLESGHKSLGNYRISESDATGGSHLGAGAPQSPQRAIATQRIA